jgi:hypothetical protein
MRLHILALALGLAGCGRGYVCPDPIGPIVRQDCDVYQTQYDAMKFELGVTFVGVGVQAGVGKEALREPSGLLQAMRLQTEALCRDFNACRVPSARYQQRREAHDQRFVSIAALSTGIRQATDAATRRALVDRLLSTLASTGAQPNAQATRRPHDPFMRPTTVWSLAQNAAPMPALAPGVPALAGWRFRTQSSAGYTVQLKFRGPAEADDWAQVALPDGQTSRCAVKPQPKSRGGGTALCHFEREAWPTRGEVTVAYQPGLTGTITPLGGVPLERDLRVNAAWLAYLPTPVQLLPVEHERPWLVLWRPEVRKRNITARCTLNGAAVGGVLHNHEASGREADGLHRYHFPLPVAVPRHVEGLPASADDLLPSAAAGAWACTVSVMGQPVRTVAFELLPNGRPKVEPTGGAINPPWWSL